MGRPVSIFLSDEVVRDIIFDGQDGKPFRYLIRLIEKGVDVCCLNSFELIKSENLSWFSHLVKQSLQDSSWVVKFKNPKKKMIPARDCLKVADYAKCDYLVTNDPKILLHKYKDGLMLGRIKIDWLWSVIRENQ